MLITLLDDNPLLYVAIVFIVILSVVLHELGHALTATWEGDPTPRIRGSLTWNPVVHMGWISIAAAFVVGIGWGKTDVSPERFRHRRWGDVLVSFAGPAVHIVLAVVAAAVLGVMNQRFGGDGDGLPMLETFWRVTVTYNVLLFLFNMIPVPPFDGFTVIGGFVDFGEFGHMLRRAHPIPFIVVWLLCFHGVIPLWRFAYGLTDLLITAFGGQPGHPI